MCALTHDDFNLQHNSGAYSEVMTLTTALVLNYSLGVAGGCVKQIVFQGKQMCLKAK